MPSEFECQSCHLEFTVGWFHYHAFDSGYVSKTLAVCKSCGTGHAVEIALRDRAREPEYDKFYDVKVTAVPERSRVRFMQLLRARQGLSLEATREMIGELPLVMERDMNEESAASLEQELAAIGLGVTSIVSGQEANPWHGPQMLDCFRAAPGPSTVGDEIGHENWVEVEILGPRRGSAGEFELEAQKCHHCKESGTLIADLPEGWTNCFRCGEEQLKYLRGWVT